MRVTTRFPSILQEEHLKCFHFIGAKSISNDYLNLKLNLNFKNAAAKCRRLHLEMELITCDGEDKV